MYIVIKLDVNGTLKPGTPPVLHLHEGDAVAEAERLAKQYPGYSYYVYRAWTVSGPIAPEITTRRII